MNQIGLNELRQMFRDFYVSKGHLGHPSYSLVPERDKSLLLINSGMAPLKPYFSGALEPPGRRMTTCQKCIRTGDLEHVGHTARHATFFEMLGSFSFGDYFKRESLLWGWEFITEVLEMPAERLWATVYEEDDDAYDIWVNEVGIHPARVVRLGKGDNFWEIGLGPCGPCSEIYFDRGEKYGCGHEDCKPGCDCDRYVEFWNHVFTQFDSDGKGNYTPLAHPNIDTGMGLERLACIMQNTDSIFDVDTIRHIMDEVCRISGVPYENGESRTDVSLRIITDHIRSVVFMAGDGILPSNEGRGYVLRRLLRRAVVHGRKLGLRGAFLADLSDKVIEVSGHEYAEIREKQETIRSIIRKEEERFAITIDQGLAYLDEQVDTLKSNGLTVLAGEQVFFLYDTLGVNPELTKEVLEEQGLTIDEDGFCQELQRQKDQSRRGMAKTEEEAWHANEAIFAGQPATKFDGYEELQENIIVNLIVKDGVPVDSAPEGAQVLAVFDRTPFYAESGGQRADTGTVSSGEVMAEVLSAAKSGEVVVHTLRIVSGELRRADEVTASVDRPARNRTARNHTATHLLHQALREELGTHVAQAGSSVDAHSLRFDFTHFEGLTPEQLSAVESRVNEAIDAFLPVTSTWTTPESAKDQGALALFSEKYGDRVRMVEVGDFSKELCGGTHVHNSGEIGGFHILSESSIGSGARRIEAITGTAILTPLTHAEALLAQLAALFKTQPETLKERAESAIDELKTMGRELETARKERAGDIVGSLLENAGTFENQTLGKVVFIDFVSDEMNAEALRDLSDRLRAQASGFAAALLSTADEKLTILLAVSDDLVQKGLHAGQMIKTVAAAAGGGGGGKADLAQAGAKDPAMAPEALAAAENYLKTFAK